MPTPMVEIKAGGPGYKIAKCSVWRDDRGRYNTGCIALRPPNSKTKAEPAESLVSPLRDWPCLHEIAARILDGEATELVLFNSDYTEIAPGVKLRARLIHSPGKSAEK